MSCDAPSPNGEATTRSRLTGLGVFVRITIVGALCLSIVGLCFAGESWATVKHPTHITAQGLGPALEVLAKEHSFQVLYRTEVVKGLTSQSVDGDLTTEQALHKLLNGTGLSYRYLGRRAITIVPGGFGGGSTGSLEGGPRTHDESTAQPRRANGGGAASGPFRMAQTDGAAPHGASVGSPTSAAGSEATPTLQEVVVTAELTRERLSDVPMSLTAITGAQMMSAHAYSLEEYVGSIPGVSLLNFGSLGSQVVIRGISAGVDPINNAVATYVDETPLSTEGPFADSFMSPNLDTFDMARIEVLRGPQGTLYGANSLGGVMKYVTNAPNPSAFASTVEAGMSAAYAGQVGHDVHAMLNIPVASGAAVRFVGYGNYYPGYVDDPSRGLENTNSSRFLGARVSFLYAPSADLSIRLNALHQERSWNDYSDEDVSPGTLAPIYGDLIQEKLISNTGLTKVDLYNATVNWSLPFARLLSATSYYSLRPHAEYAYPPLNGIVAGILGSQYGSGIDFSEPVVSLTQEFRLSSTQDVPLQWLAGLYFTNERGNERETILPVSATTHALVFNLSPDLGDFVIPVKYKEYAGFANLDYHISTSLDIAAGARYSANRQSFHESALGLFGGGLDFGRGSSENVTTYSGDVRWRPSRATMIYARVAEGFAPGGPNDAFAGTALAGSYESSSTVNYEIGWKSQFFGNRVTADLAAFDIDWKRIQLTAVVDGFAGIVNGGSARSDGFEWEFMYSPSKQLTLRLNGEYTNARLTTDTPASVNGHTGDLLPGVPLWSGFGSAEYHRALGDDYTGFLVLDGRFTGNRYADFLAGSPRQFLPHYQIFDLRIGLRNYRWSLTLYAKNLGNTLAINYVQPESLAGGLGPQDATLYTPRTLGFTAAVSFP